MDCLLYLVDEDQLAALSQQGDRQVCSKTSSGTPDMACSSQLSPDQCSNWGIGKTD